MKKIYLLIAVVVILSVKMTAQTLSGYYKQGFESSTFPPAGWQRTNVLGPSYQWDRSVTKFHSGAASAFIRYDATNGEDWLIMPKFQVLAGDSLVFYMALAFQGYQPDSLCIKISVSDSLTSSFIATILKLSEGINYPPNTTAWYRYGISLSAYSGQKIFIAFKHKDIDGDGLYIDDISLGTKPAVEVETNAIPNSAIASLAPITPKAVVINNGSAMQSFDVSMQITPGGYDQVMTVNNLNPSASTTLSFPSWTPSSPGIYKMKAFTRLAGDADNTNDTLIKVITVLGGFPNGGWTLHTALPAGRWATAPAFSKTCTALTDTGYIYLISGSDASFANVTTNLRFNTKTNVWNTKTAIPATRQQITPVQTRDKIYVIGGNVSSFTPANTNYIYDIKTDTWSTGATIPTAVGDYSIGVYQDTLIYVIGGYSGSADVNTVQIYNINTNSWTTGTIKTGTATAGGRMGISGNKIVFVGGYSQTLASNLSKAYIGIIDSLNYQVIGWTAIADYPAGSSSRLGGGVALQNDGRVYFAGGDPTGAGTAALNSVYAYNTTNGQWEIGPNMIHGVSNISGLTGIVENDTLYLVTMGGYNGVSVTTNNEWLKLGPAARFPFAQADTAICNGTSLILHAYGAKSYSWSPSIGLNDTLIANPIASPITTTSYLVSMNKGYGCPVSDEIVVTVNEPPTASAGLDITICAGQDTTLTATGGDAYSWLPATSLSNPSIANPLAAPSATTIYSVSVKNTATGCSDTAEVTITVNELPTASAGSDITICAGMDTTITATGGDTYSWMPATSLTNATIENPVAQPTETTNYTVTVTNTTTGCSDTDNVEITINELPAVSSGTDISLCAGEDTTLTATGGDIYSWLPATDLSNTGIYNPIAGPSETTNYTVSVTNITTGCSNTDDILITVNELPTASAGTDITICAGEDTTLTASGGDAYSWLPAIGLNNAAIYNPVANLTETRSYTVTVTNNVTGCSNTDEIIININALPDASVSSTDVKCNGGEEGSAIAEVDGISSYSFDWSSGDTSSSIDNLSAGEYKVTVTDINTGCKILDAVNIDEPVKLIVTISNTTATGCSGILSAEASGGTPGYSYLWNDPAAQLTSTATDLCAGEYSVTVTDANECAVTQDASVSLETGLVPVINHNYTEVYPNPCKDRLTIKMQQAGTFNRIQLVNILGENVLNINVGEIQNSFNETIEVSALSEGIYFIEFLKGDEIVFQEKFLKK
jgi:hypothetical protein